MDELLVDARDKRSEYNPYVGYLFGESPLSLQSAILRLFGARQEHNANRLYLHSYRNSQAEGPDAFSQFHLYVCSAFLVQWSKKLREMDFQVRRFPCLFVSCVVDDLHWCFQGIIMFLQSLPTQEWTDHEIEMLLSEAFVHYSTWHNAQSHFGK